MKLHIPILQELERLKQLNEKQPITVPFQPNAEEQIDLIMKNASHRLVSAAIKKQSAKCLFNERLNKRSEDAHSLASSADSQAMSSQENSIVLTGGDRAQTAPIRKPTTTKASPNSPLRKSLGGSSALQRPKTTGALLHRHGLSKSAEFAELLKSSVVNEEFQSELAVQVDHQAKDVRKMFDAMCTKLKQGVHVQFSPKLNTVNIDVSGLDPSPQRAITKIEDISNMKKKEGMALFFDPTTNTDGVEVMLRIHYKKQIDLITEESLTKDIAFFSDGNYFGIRLVKETFKTSVDLIRDFRDDGDGKKRLVSLPGWENRPPIFIPNAKCSIEVLKDEGYHTRAATAFNVSRLRIFAVCCNHPRNGVRKVHEFFVNYFKTFTANLSIAGGMSALNMAALHGNFEGVNQLVASGADVNARHKESKYHTALHEAVIGCHKDIVKFLLKNGANQLIRDELGFSPLHHACKLGHMSIARILIDGPAGKRALLLQDNNDKRPVDIAANNFMKSRVEGAMRKFNVFVQPRVSIMDR